MAHEEKLAKYHAGAYRFHVPAVQHGQWSTDDWVRYIDLCGVWL